MDKLNREEDGKMTIIVDLFSAKSLAWQLGKKMHYMVICADLIAVDMEF